MQYAGAILRALVEHALGCWVGQLHEAQCQAKPCWQYCQEDKLKGDVDVRFVQFKMLTTSGAAMTWLVGFCALQQPMNRPAVEITF